MPSVISLLKYVGPKKQSQCTYTSSLITKMSRINLQPQSILALQQQQQQQQYQNSNRSFSESPTTRSSNKKKKTYNSKKVRYIAANDEPSDHYVSLKKPPVKEYVKQPFIYDGTTIPSGEWDKKFQNPLYRPKFKNQSKLISNEDFQRQPQVGIETTDYKHITDSQIILSWMTCDIQEKIYDQYTKMMIEMYKKTNGVTSHEYVNRVLASKFNITPERCAAIIQLQYNQNQYEMNGDRVAHELGYLMDSIALSEIKEIYEMHDMEPPNSDEYIETVTGDREKSQYYVVVDDAFDYEQMTQDLQSSDEQRANILINQHTYIEDVDDNTKIIPIDKDCTTLINAKTEFINEYNAEITSDKYNTIVKDLENHHPSKLLKWKTTNWKNVSQRPRWKFVLQTTNTRNEKKKIFKQRDIYHKKYGQNKKFVPTKYKGGSKQFNVLICDSSIDYKPLRQARYDELKYCSFKHNERHIQEFSYRQAKLGWLRYTQHNDHKAWGKCDLRGENFKYTSNSPATENDIATIANMYNLGEDDMNNGKLTKKDEKEMFDNENDKDSIDDDDDEGE
jgi:hypothetical protein